MQTIQVRVTDSLFSAIQEVCDTRGILTAEKYMLELAEADAAAIRGRKIKTEPLGPKREPAKNGNTTGRKKSLRAEDVQRLFFLHDTARCTSVDALAQRFACGRSTIRRYLLGRKPLVPFVVQPSANRQHGNQEEYA